MEGQLGIEPQTRDGGSRALPGVHFDLPTDVVPSPYSAQILAFSMLTGHTRPAQPSKARRPSTAARKSPLYCSIIDNSRFPPVCPRSLACSSIGRRDSSTRRASRSFRASASAHFSTSPGGRRPARRGVVPSAPRCRIVTTALTVSHGLIQATQQAGNPVPPPKHPTLISEIHQRVTLSVPSSSCSSQFRFSIPELETTGKTGNWNWELETGYWKLELALVHNHNHGLCFR